MTKGQCKELTAAKQQLRHSILLCKVVQSGRAGHHKSRAGQGRAWQETPGQGRSEQNGPSWVDNVLTKPRPTPCKKTMGRVKDCCCFADSSVGASTGLWVDLDPKGPDVGRRTQYDIPCDAAALT